MTTSEMSHTLLEDLRWLLETGEHPDRIPARLGVGRFGLAKWLRRHDHPEMACIFDRKETKR